MSEGFCPGRGDRPFPQHTESQAPRSILTILPTPGSQHLLPLGHLSERETGDPAPRTKLGRGLARG